ncbi:MAG: carbon-nitrogen hydrolase family protein [Lautropia sp.]|nr:carbon-nitrogen hydrolase family protein [Lautropia sp.]
MENITLAALQMVSGPDVDANLKTVERLVGQASTQGARLLLLPEYFCLMGSSDRDKLFIAEQPGKGPIQQFLADCARRYGVVLVGGTVPLVSPGKNRVYNSCLVYGPDGRRLARYDKIHLFGFQRDEEAYDESATILPGRTPVVCDVPMTGGPPLRVGLSVCYDLRFPELYRQMAPMDLIVVPAAFTHTTGQAHWSLLLRARAVENQCYVLAAGQGGKHPSGRCTWGQSMVVDPWGQVEAELASGEGLVLGMLERARIRSVRQSLPALRHRVI